MIQAKHTEHIITHGTETYYENASPTWPDKTWDMMSEQTQDHWGKWCSPQPVELPDQPKVDSEQI